MRVFLLSCFIGLAVAAPQGYNYENVGNTADLSLEQYQLLQQYAQQQQLKEEQPAQYSNPAPETFTIVGNPAQLGELAQTTVKTTENSGYHVANQLVASANKLVEYELQQQLLQAPEPTVNKVAAPQSYEIPVPQEVQQQLQIFKNRNQETANLQNLNHQVLNQQKLNRPELNHQVLNQQKLNQQELNHQAPPQKPIEIQHKPLDLPPIPQIQEVAARVPETSVQYNKEFYFLSAPNDDHEDIPQNLQQQLNTLKKNIRIVFIKAPEHNGVTEAALQLAKQSIESQTAIYVLTKQQDAAGLAAKFQEIQSSSVNHKPEVVFVKYKTPEEAEHAQRTIQAQYAALNGPNKFNFGGIPENHNFVGSLSIDPRKSETAGRQVGSTGAVARDEKKTPDANYLPPVAIN